MKTDELWLAAYAASQHAADLLARLDADPKLRTREKLEQVQRLTREQGCAVQELLNRAAGARPPRVGE